jgi:phosphoglycolate phosphatase
LAVASNKYQEATSKIITELLPTIRFSATLGQREGINIKPDPQIVYDILATTNITKDDVFYIGDSGVDMQTGLNAGVETCGVTWGFRSREELESFHPHHIVDSVEELKRKIL